MRSRWTGPEALAPRQLPNEACYTSERHDDGFLCDCFNPGIGRTSNSSTGAMISTASFMTTGVPAEPTAWKVHTTGLPSRGPRCKGLVSGFRLDRRVLGNDHPRLGYPTPLTWLEVKLPAELEDPWVKGGSDLAKVTCAEAAADGVEFGMVPCVESFYAKLKFAATVFAEDEALE